MLDTEDMRKLTNSTYISLDGIIQDPQDWPSGDVSDDRDSTIQTELLMSCEIQIMGRRTYHGFAMVRPTRSGDRHSDHINAMRKIVFSSQVTDPKRDNTDVIAGDPVQAVRDLKAQDGGDNVQYGFGHLAYQLVEAGLLDELRLWVHPFFVGHGGPQDLLYRDTATTSMELANTLALKSGIVILTYTRT
jgi:dihydrofolate reductase